MAIPISKIPKIANIVGPANYSIEEKRVGSVVYFGNRKFLLEEAPNPGSCVGCDFYEGRVCQKPKKCPCTAYSRSDKKWIHFKAVSKK